MHAASLNLQRGIHATFGVDHEMFRAKRVTLFGELLSLCKKLPCIREKLPSLAKNMSVRARTYIEFVRAPQAPAKVVSPIEPVNQNIQINSQPGSSASLPSEKVLLGQKIDSAAH